MCVYVCVCVCVCVCVEGVGGQGRWDGGGGCGIVELCVGNNVVRFFSLLYIAAFRIVHVHSFLCVSLVVTHVLFS